MLHQPSFHRQQWLSTFGWILAAGCIGLAGLTAAGRQDVGDPTPNVNPKWLDRLEKQDRALLDANIGLAPPPISDDISKNLTLIGLEQLSWDLLRGKVVVVQSWTSRTEAGRSAPARAAKALAELDSGAYKLIAIHTPEGADTAEVFLERRPLEMPVIIDRSGLLLDELGIYRRPANIVIDRNGTVRFAGLNAQGLAEAAALLAAEPFDAAKLPEPREAPGAASAADIAFPADTGQGGGARDVRGQRGPDFFVQQWMNGQPDARTKVVMVEFWATW